MKTKTIEQKQDADPKKAGQAAASVKKAPKKQPKPAYSVRSNFVYVVKTAWARDRSVVFTILAQIVLIVAASTVALYLPRTVIAQVGGGVPVSTLVGTVLAFTAGLVLINAVRNYMDAAAQPPRVAMRMGANRDVLFKDMETDYENLGHQHFLDALGKARGVLRGNRAATEAVYPCLSRLGADILGFAVYIALLTAVNPLVLLLTALTTVSSVWARRRTERWQRAHDDEEGGYWSRLWYMCGIAENYKLAKDIRLFAMDDWLRDVYSANRRLLFDFTRRVQLRKLGADVADCAAAFLREGVSYAYLIGLVLAGSLSAADFVLLFAAIGGFSGWILGIMQDYAQLAQYSIGISQLREFLEYPDMFRREGGYPVPPPKDGAYTLELRDVTYRYAGAEEDTLEHISLTIRPGEKLAVVGLNGAGKTTLVLLLCGLLDPTGGIVLLDGQDIRTFNRERYYELFTAVFQEFSILPMTIAENVAQCPAEKIDRARLDRCLSLADAADAVGRLPHGADTPLNKKIHGDAAELSGGETQRLMLARALYKDAPVLLLDEPTAALDPIAESRLYAHYNELSRGRTSVYISHRLASTRFCDRIILLGHKKIEECGTHDELMAAGGEYARLFAIQSKYYQDDGGEATA